MNNENIIPATYDQWRYCIEVLGKIKLTPKYLSERLAVLEDNKNAESIKFAKLYGQEHLQRTVSWFRRAAEDLSSS